MTPQKVYCCITGKQLATYISVLVDPDPKYCTTLNIERESKKKKPINCYFFVPCLSQSTSLSDATENSKALISPHVVSFRVALNLIACQNCGFRIQAS
jgi:hypothetical protein